MSTNHPDQPVLFRGKYRIPSARLRGWDYTSPGWYFITICTKGRIPWFGEIRNGFMGLSTIGSIVAEEWQHTGIIRPNVGLDRFVVMPDHLHVIIEILHQMQRISQTIHPHHQEEWQRGCIGSIIQQFKSVCTKRIAAIGCTDFAWQTRFHDHIIRDASALERARSYIVDNPAKWTTKHDSFLRDTIT